MKKRLPKVLMLGWEFPPLINGGLGIACHDLSVAMSGLADITMIIPKSSPGFIMQNIHLIGLNTLHLNKIINAATADQQLPFALHPVPADLDPYFMEERNEDSIEDLKYLYIERGSLPEIFDTENLYGHNMISKVFRYASIASFISSSMEFDVIHAHDWMTMIAGIKIKQRTGKPLVMHIHSLEIDRSGEDSKGWVYELEKKGMEYADLLIPVSNFTAGIIQNYYGISKNKIAVVHNGIKPVKAFRSRKKIKEKIVLFVGRLTRQKGPEHFLEIASKVLKSNPEVRFVMAGTGDYFRPMIEKSSYKHIGNRFHMTGFLDSERLRYLFSVSDVYCMPSLSEPFGLSAIEAAQFGIPCVISKQSGAAEVLSGSLKFDYWDVNRAADYILNLLDDPVLRDKVVHDASANLNRISWDISAHKIINEYFSRNFISI